MCESGRLSEGLSSNFGVIKQGALYTAPRGSVLEGATLNTILSVCSSLGIPFFREFPKVSEWIEWEGAFISSTSRGLLPINKIRISESKEEELELPRCPLLETLSQILTKEMKKMSVDVSAPYLECLEHNMYK